MSLNLNRREFMKSLGLVGAASALTLGMGTKVAEATAEAKPGEHPQRYWWVKTVDKPTSGIDWGKLKSFNEWESMRGSGNDYMRQAYPDRDRVRELSELGSRLQEQWEREGKPGYTTRDHALRNSLDRGRLRGQFAKFVADPLVEAPQERDMPRWEGTPEENTKMLRVAARQMGLFHLGVVELEDQTTKKLIYNEDPGANSRKKIRFRDVDLGFEDTEENTLVLPNKARWVIVMSAPMPGETMRHTPSPLGASAATIGYSKLYIGSLRMQQFIRGLGYNSYAPDSGNGLGIYPAFGVLGGIGEMGRHNRLNSPELGPMQRLVIHVTDLPLAPTKPIDFGGFNFCKTCKICAEQCPPRSFSFDDEPTWKGLGPWNNNDGGHEAFYENSLSCRQFQRGSALTNCGICFGVCPFNKSDEASIHSIWQAVAAKTTAFNKTIAQAERTVYDQLKNPADWWNQEDRALYGIRTGRYKS